MNSWQSKLAEEYPSPDIEGIESFYFSLDGGGREIIIDLLNKYNVDLMLEIGCFLCGSTIQWLQARESLTVIGVDPWASDFAATLDRYDQIPLFSPCFSKIDDRRAFIESVRKYGSYASAVANVRSYGERFIPVKAYSPQVMYKLAELGIEPQLIYFDNSKVLDDLQVCNDLFPNAILTGDDWTWGADQGFPVQKAVNKFCAEHGYSVITKRLNWIIEKNL